MVKRRKKKQQGNAKLSDSDKVAVKIDAALKQGNLSIQFKEVLVSMKMSYLRTHSLTFEQRKYAGSIVKQFAGNQIELKKKEGYVYLMKAGEALKIGKSRNPAQRIKEVQVGNPVDVSLLAVFKCATVGQSSIFERALHRKFKSSRLRGEWFNASIADAILMETHKDGIWRGTM